jgi:hypothetical protein
MSREFVVTNLRVYLDIFIVPGQKTKETHQFEPIESYHISGLVIEFESDTRR